MHSQPERYNFFNIKFVLEVGYAQVNCKILKLEVINIAVYNDILLKYLHLIFRNEIFVNLLFHFTMPLCFKSARTEELTFINNLNKKKKETGPD